MAQASLPGSRPSMRLQSQQATHLPTRVTDELRRLEGRIRSLSVLSGLAVAVMAMAVVAAIAFGLDYWLDLSSSSRWVALCTLIATGVGLGLYGMRRLFLRVPLPELAAAVEEKHPEFGERLVSLVEFSQPGVEEKDKGSAMMRAMLERETLKLVAPSDFTDVVDHTRAAWRSLAACLGVLLLLIPFLMWRDNYRLLWARLLTPWNNFERPSNLFFEIPDGDRVVPSGEDVKLVAMAKWRNQQPQPISEVRLAWTFDGASSEKRRMAWDEAAGAYSTSLSAVQKGFQYSVSAPGAKTRDYQIRVEDRPAITTMNIDVQPPAYSGLPAEQYTASVLEILAFEHSQITMQVMLNKPVKHLDMVWLDLESVVRADVGRAARAADNAPESVILDAAAPALVIPDHLQGQFPGWVIRAIEPCVMGADKKSATIAFQADRPGRFVIRAFDEFGLDNIKEPIRSIDLRVDQPPTVDFADVNDQGTAKPDEVIEVPIYATDDLGLAAMELQVKTFPDGKLLKVISVEAERLGTKELTEAFSISLAEFGVLPDDVISVRARVADQRETPGPNEAWTHERLIRIKQDSLPYGFDAIASEREEWKALLEQLRNEVVTNRTEVQDMQKSAEQARQKNEPFDRDSQVPRLAEVQRDIAEKAEQLAAVFADHPLFEKLAPVLEQVAKDDATPAAEKTGQVPNTPDISAKEEALKQAVTELNEAEAKLKDLDAKFDQLAALEQDLFELQRLAGRTEQLAKDAEKYENQRDAAKTPEAERTPDSPQPLTPEERQAQKQKLQDRHQSLSQDLNSLLNKRPELLTAAQEELLKQLQNLLDRAGELADREDKLGEALAKEAQKAAEQLNPQQQKQQDLQQKAEAIAAEQELQQDQKVAKPVDLNEFDKAMEEMLSGNSQQAAEAQREAAEDLEKLAEALERNARLPEDPQAAAKELATRERQLKDQLQALTQKERESQQARQQAEQQQPQQPQTAEAKAAEKALAKERRELALEQAALQAAAAQLDVPRNVKDTQRDAVRNGQESVQQLLKDEPQHPQHKPESAQRATEAADRAANDLERLAQQIGTPEERQQRALNEVRGIHDEQKHLARQAEDLRSQQAEGKPLDQMADALKQHVQKEMELGQRLAELDPLAKDPAQQAAVDKQQQQALESVAAAATDLQKQNVANSDASQAQAEQALSDLRKQLEEQPTAAEAVAKATAKQAEITQAADKANQAGDQRQAQLHQQKDQQQQLAQSLEPVETPVAPELREAAKQAAYEARDALDRAANDPKQQPAAEQALARSQQTLEALADALQPDAQSPHEAAQTLAQDQKTAAEAAQQSATGAKAPTPQAASEALSELRERQQELSKLRGPETSQPEKQAAKKALAEVAKTQQQVEQLAKQQPAPAEGATEPAAPTPELQQAMQQAAQQQQAAAEALGKLAEKLQPAEAQQAMKAASQQDQQNAVTASEPRIAELTALAAKAEELAAKQEDLQKQAAEALTQNAENPEAQKQALQAQRGPQQQLNQAVRELPQVAAPLVRAEAQQAAEAADRAMEQNQEEQAAEAQSDTAEALHQLARQAERQAAALTEQTGQELAMANDEAEKQATPETREPQAGQTSGKGQPADPLQALADRARELAAEQRALAEETALAGDPNANQLAMNEPGQPKNGKPGDVQPQAGEMPEEGLPPAGQPEAGQPQQGQPQAGETPPAGKPDAGQPQQGQPENGQPLPDKLKPNQPQAVQLQGEPQQPNLSAEVAQVLREQQKIALAAKHRALNTEFVTGADSKATQAANQFAEQTQEAAEELAAAAIESAAETAKEAATAGQQATQEFRQLPQSQGGANEEMAEDSDKLSERQARLADRLEQLASSPAARRAAQQQSQEQLQKETRQLTQELNDVAESFGMQPLQQQNKAQEAQSSESAAQQAQQAMQSAQQDLQQSNPQQAAQQAAEAAQALRDAGKLAKSAGQGQGQGKGKKGKEGQAKDQEPGQNGPPSESESPIPTEGALNVAQAAQSLNKIGEQLAKDEGQPSSDGKPGEGQKDGEGQSPDSEGESGSQQADSGQPKDGEEQSSQQQGGQPKASQNLKQTAANLRQAMQQFGMQPGQPGQPGKQKGKPSSPQNAKSSKDGANDSDFGNTDEAHIVELENHLKGLSARNWGELPGTLKTEILQAARKKPDGDYAKLIRKYFDEISKTQRPDLPGAMAPAAAGAKP